jgi:hypothetical protein
MTPRARFQDIAPVRDLGALDSLSLCGTAVSDLNSLSRLFFLKNLDVSGTRTTNNRSTRGPDRPTGTQTPWCVTWLRYPALSLYNHSKSRALGWVTCGRLLGSKPWSGSGTQIDEIAPLAGLLAVRTLWYGFDSAKIDDLAPLDGLNSLTEVYVRRESQTIALIDPTALACRQASHPISPASQ